MHQLRWVVHVVQSKDVRQFMNDYCPYLITPAGVPKDVREIGRVQHCLTGDEHNRFARPLRDLTSPEPGDVTRKLGHLGGIRPGDEDRSPSFAVQFRLIRIPFLGARSLYSWTVEDKGQPGRCCHFSDGLLHEPFCPCRSEVRSDHIVDGAAGVVSHHVLIHPVEGIQYVLRGTGGRWWSA